MCILHQVITVYFKSERWHGWSLVQTWVTFWKYTELQNQGDFSSTTAYLTPLSDFTQYFVKGENAKTSLKWGDHVRTHNGGHLTGA